MAISKLPAKKLNNYYQNKTAAFGLIDTLAALVLLSLLLLLQQHNVNLLNRTIHSTKTLRVNYPPDCEWLAVCSNNKNNQLECNCSDKLKTFREF